MPRARRHGTAPLLEEPLHEPVLETVERDDGKAATGLQHLLGGRQPALEPLQLLVQMAADRLEGPGRRVLPGAGLVAHRLADDPGELARPLARPRGDAAAGDAAGLRLLPIMVDDAADTGIF